MVQVMQKSGNGRKVEKARPNGRSSGRVGVSDAYWSQPLEVLLRSLESQTSGLTGLQALARLGRDGPNHMDSGDAPGPMRLLMRQFTSPLVLILVFGAAVSLGLREWTEAAIILVLVTGSAVLGTVQEYRASTAVASLRQRLALTVRVWRDGATTVVPASEVVRGDVIELAAGNLIPADGLILAATDFLVTEASLTGEPFPVEKRPGLVPAEAGLGERLNSVFLGTSVRSGTAKVLVVHTGRQTAMGGLAASLRQRNPDTAFTRGMQRFGYLLMRVMLLTVVFVVVVNQLLHRPVAESLLFAVALAVGLSPELLPAIVSVTLSHGARAMAARGVIVRRLEAIENLGSMDVLCTDKTGTLTAGEVELSDFVSPTGEAAQRVLELAFVNASLETGIENPLDAAIVTVGQHAGLGSSTLVKIDEIPYDFIRKRLTIVVEEKGPEGGVEHVLICKGAVAQVLEVCSTLRSGAGELALDEQAIAQVKAYCAQRGSEGFRVLALGTRRLPARVDYDRSDEQGLCLEGFLLFFDPPKAQAAQTIKDLAELGIETKVITGDNRFVAAHVAQAIGLDAQRMLTGETIAGLSDEALWQRAEETALFVEVDPQQKDRIVRALQHRGHVVGYLGDGINDAAALQAADVGISVDGAVDVARESADLVLLRPDLDVLRAGVQEGRRTFANTLKYIRITTSANFGNMISMALAVPLLPFLPLAAKQILLNNFLSDLPSVAVSTDRVDQESIENAQRWDVGEVRRFMITFGLISTAFDLMTFGLLRWVFHADEAVFRTAWFLVSVLTELAVLLVLRTRRPVWRSRPGPILLWATLVVAVLVFCLPYTGALAHLFGFVPLPPILLWVTLGVVVGYVGCTELGKRWYCATPDG
jgi:P-type Mg2+ transporter